MSRDRMSCWALFAFCILSMIGVGALSWLAAGDEDWGSVTVLLICITLLGVFAGKALALARDKGW